MITQQLLALLNDAEIAVQQELPVALKEALQRIESERDEKLKAAQQTYSETLKLGHTSLEPIATAMQLIHSAARRVGLEARAVETSVTDTSTVPLDAIAKIAERVLELKAQFVTAVETHETAEKARREAQQAREEVEKREREKAERALRTRKRLRHLVVAVAGVFVLALIASLVFIYLNHPQIIPPSDLRVAFTRGGEIYIVGDNTILYTDEAVELSVSYDGEHLAYRGTRDGMTLLNWLEDDFRTEQVGDGTYYDLTWSPDSTKIAYTLLYTPSIGVYDLTTNESIIIEAENNPDFYWSPNSRLILYQIGNSYGTTPISLHIYDFDTNEDYMIFQTQEGESVFSIEWSENSQYVMFDYRSFGNPVVVHTDGAGVADLEQPPEAFEFSSLLVSNPTHRVVYDCDLYIREYIRDGAGDSGFRVTYSGIEFLSLIDSLYAGCVNDAVLAPR